MNKAIHINQHIYTLLTEDSYGVHGLEPLEHLPREALVVRVVERLLGLDDPVQVAVHQLQDGSETIYIGLQFSYNLERV